MNSRSFHGCIHLVELDAGAANAVRALPLADRWTWQDWPSLSALHSGLESDSKTHRARVCIAADALASLDPMDLRELQVLACRVDVLMVVRDLGNEDLRFWMGQGVAHVERLPLPPVSIDVLFSDRRYLASLFPGPLLGHRRETLEFELPSCREAVPPLVRQLCERCESFGHPIDFVRSQLPLVVDEAVTNAMEHGHLWNRERLVRVTATLTERSVEIVIEDEGPGFQRHEVADPLAEENRRRSGGRGLYLMESLMDDVEYRDEGRTVVLRKLHGQVAPRDATALSVH